MAIQPGDTYGDLTIISKLPCRKTAGGNFMQRFLVKCKCGVEKPVDYAAIRPNKPGRHTVSCGCHRRATLTTHGLAHGKTKRLYHLWWGMVDRCTNPKAPNYKIYGGRGIKVCAAWLDVRAFVAWAYSTGYSDTLSIERERVNDNYEPGNCKWIPLADQAKNRQHAVNLTAFGETKSVSDWVKDARCAVKWTALRSRVKKGWDHETAIIAPSLIQSPQTVLPS